MSAVPDPAANLAALAPYLPSELLSYLGAGTPAKSTLTGAAGAWNIDLGGALLYPESAEAFAAGQVDAFLANPVRRISYAVSNFLFEQDQLDGEGRFTPKPLDGPGLAAQLAAGNEMTIAGEVAQALLKQADGAVLDWFPDPDAGHLVCFGLGLGLHLPGLIGALDIRDVVVVDPYPEFLRHSLSVVDWRPLVESLEARGGRLYFLFGNDPAALAAGVQEALRRDQYARIDGAYMFEHYQAAPLPETIRQVQDRGPLMELSKGFFEDEVRMLSQTAENMLSGQAFYLDPRRPVDAPCAGAVVLGSGPSADAGMEHVKRLLEQGAALFSVGTGLSVALEHGLHPDLHFEIENEGTILDGLDALTDKFDLKTVTLFGSWTVAPSNAAYFKDSVFYFRDTNSGSRLFAGPEEAIYMSGPTVANLACRFAIAMGIPDVYLFGVDLGSRNREVHHSESSLYTTLDDDFWRGGRGMDALEIEAPGNMGGVVYTSRQFKLTSTTIEGLFRHFDGTRFHNCSDGILLAGAAPLRPEEANLPEDSVPKRLLPPDFAVSYSQGNVRSRLLNYRDALEDWHAAFRRAVAEADTDMDRLIDGLLPQIALAGDSRRHGAEAAVQIGFSGSLLSMLQIAYALLRRLPAEDRRSFMEHVKAEMVRAVDGAVDRMRQVTEDLIEKAGDERRAP